MIRTDRLLPFLAGVGVATLLVGGVALAWQGDPPPDAGDLVAQPAGVVDTVTAPVAERDPDPEPVAQIEPAVLTVAPLSAIEAGTAPPETRVKRAEPAPAEEKPEPAEVAAPAPKVDDPPASKPEKKKHDEQAKKPDEKPKHEEKAKHHEKKPDEKPKHDDAWWPHAHGEVTACTRVGDDGARLDWTVHLKGGEFTIVDGGGGQVDGTTVRFAGVDGHPVDGHDKVKVVASIRIERADGSGTRKDVHPHAWRYLGDC